MKYEVCIIKSREKIKHIWGYKYTKETARAIFSSSLFLAAMTSQLLIVNNFYDSWCALA